MKKRLLIICGTVLILLSFLILNIAYTPKAGPIGNGIKDTLVWIQFCTGVISGICAFGLVFTIKEKNDVNKP